MGIVRGPAAQACQRHVWLRPERRERDDPLQKGFRLIRPAHGKVGDTKLEQRLGPIGRRLGSPLQMRQRPVDQANPGEYRADANSNGRVTDRGPLHHTRVVESPRQETHV